MFPFSLKKCNFTLYELSIYKRKNKRRNYMKNNKNKYSDIIKQHKYHNIFSKSWSDFVVFYKNLLFGCTDFSEKRFTLSAWLLL